MNNALDYIKKFVSEEEEVDQYLLREMFDNDYLDCHRDLIKGLESTGEYDVMVLEGGCEGGGEYCYGVIRLGDKFIKGEWSYYSYDCDDFDNIENTLRFVTPKTKTITVYE